MKNRPILLPLLSLCLLAANPMSLSASEVEIGPMVGHVGPQEARIWIQAKGASQLGVRIDGRDVSGPQLTSASGFMGHVKVCGLKPNQTYDYQVLLNGKPAKGKFATKGTLKTAPEDGQAGKIRVAFSSCYGRAGNDSQAARQYIAGMPNLDLMLELGDNHYADSTKPEVQRTFYASQRGTSGWHAHARNHPSMQFGTIMTMVQTTVTEQPPDKNTPFAPFRNTGPIHLMEPTRRQAFSPHLPMGKFNSFSLMTDTIAIPTKLLTAQQRPYSAKLKKPGSKTSLHDLLPR